MNSFFISLITSTIIFAILQTFWPKRRVYCNDDGWQPVDTIPDSGVEIIITDGEKVRISTYRTFNRKGECIMREYASQLVRNWRHMPKPPMRTKT